MIDTDLLIDFTFEAFPLVSFTLSIGEKLIQKESLNCWGNFSL